MLRVLLIFAAIIIVFSQNCEEMYEYFGHDDTILSHLNGTYYFQVTSSDYVIDCEKMTWTGSGNSLEAILQSPGCCRRVHSPIYTNPGYVNFTVTPINGVPGCPLDVEETITFKTVTTTGVGGTLCLTCTACRSEREGVYEICRQQVVSQTILNGLLSFLALLINNIILILLGYEPLIYDTVSHAECDFPENNCDL